MKKAAVKKNIGSVRASESNKLHIAGKTILRNIKDLAGLKDDKIVAMQLNQAQLKIVGDSQTGLDQALYLMQALLNDASKFKWSKSKIVKGINDPKTPQDNDFATLLAIALNFSVKGEATKKNAEKLEKYLRKANINIDLLKSLQPNEEDLTQELERLKGTYKHYDDEWVKKTLEEISFVGEVEDSEDFGKRLAMTAIDQKSVRGLGVLKAPLVQAEEFDISNESDRPISDRFGGVGEEKKPSLGNEDKHTPRQRHFSELHAGTVNYSIKAREGRFVGSEVGVEHFGVKSEVLKPTPVESTQVLQYASSSELEENSTETSAIIEDADETKAAMVTEAQATEFAFADSAQVSQHAGSSELEENSTKTSVTIEDADETKAAMVTEAQATEFAFADSAQVSQHAGSSELEESSTETSVTIEDADKTNAVVTQVQGVEPTPADSAPVLQYADTLEPADYPTETIGGVGETQGNKIAEESNKSTVFINQAVDAGEVTQSGRLIESESVESGYNSDSTSLASTQRLDEFDDSISLQFKKNETIKASSMDDVGDWSEGDEDQSNNRELAGVDLSVFAEELQKASKSGEYSGETQMKQSKANDEIAELRKKRHLDKAKEKKSIELFFAEKAKIPNNADVQQKDETVVGSSEDSPLGEDEAWQPFLGFCRKFIIAEIVNFMASSNEDIFVISKDQTIMPIVRQALLESDSELDLGLVLMHKIITLEHGKLKLSIMEDLFRSEYIGGSEPESASSVIIRGLSQGTTEASELKGEIEKIGDFMSSWDEYFSQLDVFDDDEFDDEFDDQLGMGHQINATKVATAEFQGTEQAPAPAGSSKAVISEESNGGITTNKNLSSTVADELEELNEQKKVTSRLENEKLYQKITQLEQALKKKEAEQVSLTGQKDAAQEKVTSLQGEMAELNKKLEDANTASNTKDEELAKFQENFDESNAKISTLESSLSAIEKEKKGLQDENNLVKKKLNRLNDELSAEKAALEANKKQSEEEIKQLKQQIEEKKAEQVSLTGQKDAAQDTVTSLQGEIAELNKKLEDANTASNTKDEELAKFKENFDESLENSLSAIKKEKKSLQDKNNQVQEEVNRLKNQLSAEKAALEVNKKQSEEEIRQLKQQIEEKEAEQVSLTGQKNAADEQVTSLQGKMAELNKKLEDANTASNKKDEELAKFKENFDESLENSLSAIKKEKKSLQDKNNQVQEEVNRLKSQLSAEKAALEVNKKQSEEEIRQLKQQIEEKEAEQVSLTGQKNAADEQVTSLQGEMAELNKKLEDANNVSNKKDKDLANAKKKSNELTAQLQESYTQRESLQAKLETVIGAYSAAKISIGGLEKQLRQAQEQNKLNGGKLAQQEQAPSKKQEQVTNPQKSLDGADVKDQSGSGSSAGSLVSSDESEATNSDSDDTESQLVCAIDTTNESSSAMAQLKNSAQQDLVGASQPPQESVPVNQKVNEWLDKSTNESANNDELELERIITTADYLQNLLKQPAAIWYLHTHLQDTYEKLCLKRLWTDNSAQALPAKINQVTNEHIPIIKKMDKNLGMQLEQLLEAGEEINKAVIQSTAKAESRQFRSQTKLVMGVMTVGFALPLVASAVLLFFVCPLLAAIAVALGGLMIFDSLLGAFKAGEGKRLQGALNGRFGPVQSSVATLFKFCYQLIQKGINAESKKEQIAAEKALKHVIEEHTNNPELKNLSAETQTSVSSYMKLAESEQLQKVSTELKALAS
ncbi:hypothetical protein [Cysteiniphilum marinum]|nr:hypothetical protein [Cysteiniphilum marinum]